MSVPQSTVTIFGKELDPHGVQFMSIIETIPRFQYRKGFTPLSSESHFFSISTDKYWGCCIRSGQGMLAQFIHRYILKYPNHYLSHFPKLKSFLSLFDDSPDMPFSIHSICKELTKIGVHEGTWVTPSQVAQSFEGILANFGIECYVPMNGVFNISEVLPKFSDEKPVFAMIPQKCGIEKFDSRCVNYVKASVSREAGLGFIGGTNGQAFFYIGYYNNDFLYFDPHSTKKCVTKVREQTTLFEIPISAAPMNSISPSLLLGFMWNNKEEMENDLKFIEELEFSPLSIIQSEARINEANCEEKDSWDIISLE